RDDLVTGVQTCALPIFLPGSSREADAAIRRAIVHLHERVLGRHDAPDSAEVARTFDLFAGIVADARTAKGIDKREAYHCRANVRSEERRVGKECRRQGG